VDDPFEKPAVQAGFLLVFRRLRHHRHLGGTIGD